MRTYIIAEAGVNHDGSIDQALRLVDVAAAAGVDAVKFQTFTAATLVIGSAGKAAYQKRTTDAGESQYEMIRKLELSREDHDVLLRHSRGHGLEFLSTPFDPASLRLLTSSFGLQTIKVSSGDITNAPFLLEVGRQARTVVLSTGMCTLSEVEAALGVLAFAFIGEGVPSRQAFERAFASDAGQAALRDRAWVLHCTTEYPAPFAEVNLRAMLTLQAAFGLKTGYSDHTSGIAVPVAAVALGAQVIEKHFTLDRTLPGPDHAASLEPQELADMVRSIREVELSLGDGVKRPTASEWSNRAVARKSLVAAADIRAGEPLRLDAKRPGSGVSPFEFWNLEGIPASRAFRKDELLDG